MGTHLRVHSKRFPMNTNMTGFIWCFLVDLCIVAFLTKVALALEGLKNYSQINFGDLSGDF